MPVEELLIDVYFHFNHNAKHKEEYREFLETWHFKDPEVRQHTVAELGEMRQPLSATVAGTAKLL